MREKPFSLSISRNSKDRVGIEVRCNKSRIKFLELDLNLEEYAYIVTGLSCVEVDGKVKGLQYVGKEKVVEDRSTILPKDVGLSKEKARTYLEENCKEEGWHLSVYLGSKNSLVSDGSGTYQANYSVYKYVEETNND